MSPHTGLVHATVSRAGSTNDTGGLGSPPYVSYPRARETRALRTVPHFSGDDGAPNGTSIAVLAEYGGASALLAADAHAPVLVQSIRRLLASRRLEKLKVDVFKVSHHGSQNNVSSELVQLLDCPRYLISTNGDHFFHPDRQAIARILKYGGNEITVEGKEYLILDQDSIYAIREG